MKSAEQLSAEVATRLRRSWAEDLLAEAAGGAGGAGGSSPTWPARFATGKTSSAELATTFGAFLTELAALREWATAHDVQLTWVERRVAGTPQQAPSHITVPTVDVAAAIAGGDWPVTLAVARARAGVLVSQYPHAADAATLRAVTSMSDVEFDLLVMAADWFALNSGAGLTPRQVPIEGLHAKWLNSRHGLLARLANRPSLELLPPHPARINFTYLDPHYRALGRRVHDSATVGDAPAIAYRPRIVVISENKDTAIHFPPIAGGVSVEGAGRGGSTVASFDWIRDADCLIYWGDMDADGMEILNEFRGAGLPAQSLFMDPDSYAHWRRFGTNTDQRGNPLKARVPSPTPHLNSAERALYLDLCDPQFTGFRRIEQERIPLPTALATVRWLAGLDETLSV